MYVEQLRSDPRELSSLYEDLLIGVTRFFRDERRSRRSSTGHPRDRRAYEAPEEQIRVWVPGCATGQEAYSIAMLLHERLSRPASAGELKILATDVHKASLEVASAGIYTAEQVAGVGRERLRALLHAKPDGYQVSQALRESIVFAPHNLIRDAPFTKLDLIAAATC
jgi:two-component system, chemotaxis family, CheB/CheR fusion protein